MLVEIERSFQYVVAVRVGVGNPLQYQIDFASHSDLTKET